ncbi:CDP-diacylglycerol--serine O-phosphatidyltransferase [Desulfuribacillus alkaliarsenatis]|uniref:CDP-diacylglycerol--serine O-phosphatidyltransferase n=1 Tax=Desulfuribacillus alkaliarsenatis TaxID=766136 RepID=A0A1E5G4E5_9FIRM|nr:CDP-diacylglycerol--serine O-phosphatidyltransferase [Desulfuribacillus alkaliarsenatis]OEF97965.1 CDP-diacylglycerol--serine O-phosphatidyltransferase [Desulfuribacillus alkaliarsenatis]
MFAKALPSILTVGNLFLGIIAIILVFEGRTDYAAIMVIVGMLLDGLDGRVARMLNTQSEFGKELDSLSDIVTFGVAPAFIMYAAVLSDLGTIGWIITGVFPICGALRLARFNVQDGVPGYFVGLPITAAGGILATFALYYASLPFYVLVIGMLLLSYLMISNIKYPSFKTLGLPRIVYYVSALVILIIILVSLFYPSQVNKLLFLPLALYALYGLRRKGRPYKRFFRKRKKTDNKDS